MVTIAIAYHSGYGHTAKIAETIRDSLKAEGANVSFINVDEINDDQWNELSEANAIIFGTPTYMGGVSAQFKKFMDTSSKLWQQKAWKNKIAAGFTNSASYSGDKLATLQHLFHFSMQHRMIWVGQAEDGPFLSDLNVPTIETINRVGSYSGLMTQSNHTASADIAPPTGDVETAKLFAKRILEIAKKCN